MMRILLSLLGLLIFRNSERRVVLIQEEDTDKSRGWWAWLRKLVSALGSFASVATGIFVGVIAWLTYLNSLEFRARDEAKDELNITPVLSIIIHDSNELDIENVGLGPAVIEEVYFKADEKLAIIDQPSIIYDGLAGSSFSSGVTSTYKDVVQYTFDCGGLSSLAKKKGIEFSCKLRGDAPLSGEIIKKDGKIVLAKINSSDVIESNKISSEERQSWIYFTNAGSAAYNIGVCYKSFTGKATYLSTMRGGITHRKIGECKDAREIFKAVPELRVNREQN